MSKKAYKEPQEALERGYLHLKDIPLCRYSLTTDHEKHIYTNRQFVRFYHDMFMIREFELMLAELHTKGEYHGISYRLTSGDYLSIGEEAIAVGEAYCMRPNDLLFGTHRSHASSIAKALAAIEKMSEGDLAGIMRQYHGGEILSVIADQYENVTVKTMAAEYFLYGELCEIFGKKTGFQKGLGGSAHAHFKPFGIYPNSTSPAGAAGLGLGAALYQRNKEQNENEFVIANVGEGSAASGAFTEALHMSCMEQIREAWEGKKGLSLLIAVINNQLSADARTVGETAGFGEAARIGAGISENALYAERVDGTDPMAVIDAIERKKELLLRGEGPVLLEFVTYRRCPHSMDGANERCDKEEFAAWNAYDPIKRYRKKLIESGIVKESELIRLEQDVKARLMFLCKIAADNTLSPVLTAEETEALMYAGSAPSYEFSSANASVLMPKEDCPRVKTLAEKSRFGFDENGEPIAKNRRYDIADAVFEAVFDRFYQDYSFILYGNSIRGGGRAGIFSGMSDAIAQERFFNIPAAESAAVTAAIGYAVCGGRVCAEFAGAELFTRAGNEIMTQLSRWHGMSGGVMNLPIVLRVPIGRQEPDLSSWIAGIPGLKVIYPVTPYDMKGMLTEALYSNDPVIVLESEKLYSVGECFHEEGVPKEAYRIDIGSADIKKEGKDLTILSIGAALYSAMEAAKQLEEYGIDAEVVDARSLVPFDYDALLASVVKTGRLIIVGEGAERGSFMKEIASNVTEFVFDSLDAPPIVVGARNLSVYPREAAKEYVPAAETIVDAVHQKIMPLKDYTPKRNFTKKEKLRLAKDGI